MLKKLKRRFKKTTLGRLLRHIRNFYWRAFIDEQFQHRNEPDMWIANYMRQLGDN